MSETAVSETPAAGNAPPPTEAPASNGSAAPVKAEGTIATGNDGGDKEQAVPANFPTNWKEIMAAGDEAGLKKLNRYQSPGNFFKAYRALEQKIGTGELVRSKPEGEENDPAFKTALNEWRAQVGIPEKPEGYLERVPDGIVVGEDDKPVIESFLKDMHAADMPPAQVHQALRWYYNNQENMAVQRLEADKANRAKNEDVLRAEWGPEYRPTLNGIRSLFDTHGSKDLLNQLFSARMPDGSPLGDNIDVLKFLANLSREVNPHGTVTPIEGKTALETVETELEGIEREMKDNRSDYWTNERKQARWRELDELRTKHKKRAG